MNHNPTIGQPCLLKHSLVKVEIVERLSGDLYKVKTKLWTGQVSKKNLYSIPPFRPTYVVTPNGLEYVTGVRNGKLETCYHVDTGGYDDDYLYRRNDGLSVYASSKFNLWNPDEIHEATYEELKEHGYE